MSNSTAALRGLCPPPFYDEASFGKGGYVEGRYCVATDIIKTGLRCCLGCPATYWTYPDDFDSLTRIAGPINLIGLVLQLYMLLCFIILPLEKTRRHYLNICLIVSICFLELGFIIPWAGQPPKCYDEITPNDMYTSMPCAWSGGFVVVGGAAINSWILVRTLFMHLQICWDQTPGRTFFWGAQTFAWGATVLIAAMELAFTGVSFRFGNYCHINHEQSLQTFWLWLFIMAGISLFMQLATFGYCIHVYLKNINSQKPQHSATLSEPSIVGSTRSQTARAVYRRLCKVMAVQWRGLLLATITIANVAYFAIVFLLLDDSQQHAIQNLDLVLPWAYCLIANEGDKNKCLELARAINVNEPRIIATLIVLAVIGIESFLLLCRWEMITGWRTLFGGPRKGPEWVSIDANERTDLELTKFGATTSTGPIVSSSRPSLHLKEFSSPAPTFQSPQEPAPRAGRFEQNTGLGLRNPYPMPMTPGSDRSSSTSWPFPESTYPSTTYGPSHWADQRRGPLG